MYSARVLIVDDDILIRSLMEEALPPRGFSVETSESGSAAVDRLKAEPFDVVLLDQFLPGLSGIEVFRKIRELPDPPQVVFFTGHGSVESAVEAIKEGAYDYIEKPCKIEEIEIILKRACEMNALTQEVSRLRRVVSRPSLPSLTAHSPEMQEVVRVISKCAPTDSTVLIQGETGTGKELVANEIYRRSLRADKPMLPLNCGTLQEQLLESELFGHEKGAFTGAANVRPGLFEVADGGTIFLDEIGEMQPNTQVKLLRVLQSGEVRRVGGNRVRHVNTRVIASTNKDLRRAVADGSFREDLYYRLSVLTLHVPPLRERKQEIPYLVAYFLDQASARRGGDRIEFSEEAMNVLLKHDWPGNVRELGNVIELAVVLAEEPVIRATDLPPHLMTVRTDGGNGSGTMTLEEVEMNHLIRVLNVNDGNKRKTARELGIDTKTLYNKLKKIEELDQ
jgi:DNA-binding NtrC family response regulator